MAWLWIVAVLAILLGPFVIAIVYGIRHRDSGAPAHDDTLEAEAVVQMAKDSNDIRTWGNSRG